MVVFDVCVCGGMSYSCSRYAPSVHGFMSLCVCFALSLLILEKACSLGLWGDVLSADFVRF